MAPMLARLTESLDAIVDKHYKDYAEKIGRFTNDIGVTVQGSFQDAANRMQDQIVGSLQQELDTLNNSVQALQTTLADLVAGFEALWKKAGILVEETEQRIARATHQAVESALQEIAAKFRAENASATLETEFQERITSTASKTVEEALRGSEDRLALLIEDRVSKSTAIAGDHLTRGLGGTQEQINQMVTSATTTIDTRIKSLAGEVADSTRREVEKSLQEASGQMVRQAAQTLQEQAQLVTQGALLPLEKAVQDLRSQIQEESAKARQSCEHEVH